MRLHEVMDHDEVGLALRRVANKMERMGYIDIILHRSAEAQRGSGMKPRRYGVTD